MKIDELRVRFGDLPDRAQEDLEERLNQKISPNKQFSLKYVLDQWLIWNGIFGYTGHIIGIMETARVDDTAEEDR